MYTLKMPVLRDASITLWEISTDTITQAQVEEMLFDYETITASIGSFLREHTRDILDNEQDVNTIHSLYSAQQQLLLVEDALEEMSDLLEQLFEGQYTKRLARIKRIVETENTQLSLAFSANLAVVGMAQNDAVKKLAGWAAILTVPTIIASVYGMNFENMPELHWHYGYLVSLFLMFITSFGVWAKFRKMRWL